MTPDLLKAMLMVAMMQAVGRDQESDNERFDREYKENPEGLKRKIKKFLDLTGETLECPSCPKRETCRLHAVVNGTYVPADRINQN